MTAFCVLWWPQSWKHNYKHVHLTYFALFAFTPLCVHHGRYTRLYSTATIYVLYIQLMTRGVGHLGGAGPPFPQRAGPLGSPSGTRPFLLHPREEERPPRQWTPVGPYRRRGKRSFSLSSHLTKVILFIMRRFYWVVPSEMNRSK